jgi:phosphatidylinositol-3-phosphatase
MSRTADPAGAGWPSQAADSPWPASDAGEPAASGTGSLETAPRSLRWVDEALTPSRVRLLGLFSLLATGIVIWSGLNQEGSPNISLAAALLHRQTVTSPAAAGSTESGPGASSAGGAGTTSERAPAAPSPAEAAPESAGAGAAQSASSPAPAPATAPVPAGAPSESKKSPSPGSSAPSTTLATGTKIKHVFVITLASPGYEQTWGSGSAATYLTTQLRPLGTLLSNYYAIAHLDLPNYIAMISGQGPNADTEANCPTFSEFPANSTLEANGQLPGAGCVYPVSVVTLADQLTSSRHQWRAYAEDLANGSPPVTTCRHPSSGQSDPTQSGRPGDEYAARHNPFVYFHSLLDLGDCASDDLPLTQLAADLTSTSKTANYSFIAPNLCHDGSETVCAGGEPGGLARADAFLKQWVPLILASPAYKNDGLLVITFADAPASDASGCCRAPGGGSGSSSTGAPVSVTGGGRVGALLLSRYTTPGALSSTPYNHYSLLRTIEDLFGLRHLANANQTGVKAFGSDVLKGVFPKKSPGKAARAARSTTRLRRSG